MARLFPPLVSLCGACVLAGALLSWQVAAGSRPRQVDLGFWFEPVTFSSLRLGGPLHASELALIQTLAEREIAQAFAGMRIRVSARRDTRYRIRVVQDVKDARFQRPVHVAGQSRGMTGFGGEGVVSFEFAASSAVVYASAGMVRGQIVEAIGRGVGRSAVHEFTHQLLPRAPIHASRDRSSYEYYSAARVEQYFGELRWDLAKPLLQARLAAAPVGD